MKPYYQDKWVTIYHGDCREILPALDVKVDLVLTDPPYGINYDGEWLSQMNLAHGKPANKTDARIIGDNGMDLRFLFEYPKWIVFGFPYVIDTRATGWVVWDKQPGLMEADRTMTTPVEMASSNVWKGFRLVRCMWAGYMRDNGEHRFEHPTQKPTKLIDYCINRFNEQMLCIEMSRYLQGEFERANVTNKQIAKLFPSKSGGLTGCVSNWLIGYNFPTQLQYEAIREFLGEGFLSREYTDIQNNEHKEPQQEKIIILDPFLGSGTTCYCAKKLNRYSIGIEMEERYAEIAAKRCSQEVMELKI